MSSTGRGAPRRRHDVYLSPHWCLRRLFERLELPGGRWLEPAAGEGDLIRAAARADVDWTAVELRAECRPLLEASGARRIRTGDFRRLCARIDLDSFAVILSNPPFLPAQEFAEIALRSRADVVLLLRLSFLASSYRSDWLQGCTPDVYVLPDRPSFVGRGTDSCDYAWFHWPAGERRRRRGSLEVLARTSLEERQADLRARTEWRAAQSTA